MSASLVGSEMCIRDRSVGAYVGPSAFPSVRPSIGLSAGFCASAVNSYTCLLYTSDAADDM
eukprot:7287937-Alexandrium_andersonii.AAC.1